MKNVITIFKKEFYRVMSDKRLIFTTIILPGLAIYIMYSFMGNAITDMETDIDNHKMVVYTENMPTEFRNVVNLYFEENPTFIDVNEVGMEEAIKQVRDGDADVILQFEENFMEKLDDYELDGYELPNIQTSYNPSERYSSSSLGKVHGFIAAFIDISGYERYGEAYDILTLNAETGGTPTVIEYENKGIGQGLAMLLPMLIVMFLFSGAMSIGPDSIAGEKERGTIATLLITPVKRSEIALGKVLSLTVISLFSAVSSFIGIMLSLDRLIGQSDISSFEIYSITDFLMLFTVILSTVLVIVGIISVVSGYAKSIKEAGMLILPFYFVSIVVGISTMFSGEASTELVSYMIPIFSSVNMIIAILTFEVVPMFFIMHVVSNVVYVTICVYVLNRLFQSETVMFSK